MRKFSLTVNPSAQISALLAVALLPLTTSAATIPVDPLFDWTGYTRNLSFQILASANIFAVNAPAGYIEPIAPPTIGNSFRRAVDTWNADMAAMNPRWTLQEYNGIGAAPTPLITVRMSNPAVGGNPAELTPPGSAGAEIDGDPRGGPGGRNVLAFFRVTGTDATGLATNAEIVFNSSASWGINNNTAPNTDFDYDPIIVALHEIGHAIRLDHDPAGGSIGTNAATVDGNIMRPGLKPGTHNTNPTNPLNLAANFARNPSAMDVAAATSAAAVPEPATLTLALIALGTLSMFRLKRKI
jgi:hypothetical protein